MSNTNNANTSLQLKIGKLLIWLGVLAWLPFLFARFSGNELSIFPFLALHLSGVVGGARLRTAARRKIGLPAAKHDRWQIAGRVLLLLGILAWAPYFYQKYALGLPVDVKNYLPFHLSGVLGGAALLVIRKRVIQRARRPDPQPE